LDIAAGSGDLSLDALSLSPEEIVATDFSQKMLTEFQHKLAMRTDAKRIRLLACDGTNLPFPDQSFDATMIAFGIRNFVDRLKGLKEMARVLKPGGISIILELTEPTAPIVRQGYLLYTRLILPSIGKIISRHNAAYAYLPQSISKFPAKTEFLDLMKQAGFSQPEAHSLTFGAATIFKGRK
jgi:demethylmenaquinone methyltransferase/2-methoxy-6-polyprenyl-1,4-benzoquinol methylase